MLSYFNAQLGAYGAKHGAIFALPNIKFYDKVTVSKTVGMVQSLIESCGMHWVPRN